MTDYLKLADSNIDEVLQELNMVAKHMMEKQQVDYFKLASEAANYASYDYRVDQLLSRLEQAVRELVRENAELRARLSAMGDDFVCEGTTHE